jgi:3-phosphoshikimate 1-carboxyvinyltransferase
VEELEDGLVIEGGWSDGGADGVPDTSGEVTVETFDDHRIAMAFALVGLRRGGVVVAEPGVVAKSYPGFWEDFATLTR